MGSTKEELLATEGCVFNIQKFSLNDGPGVRTVVFLKGCPLRCAWCANPESQRRSPEVEWKASACVGCGTCISQAPGAGTAQSGGKLHVDVRNLRGDSDEAKAAVAACPARALSIVGKVRTVEEVLAVCLQDKPFYEESGGGVTLSGGEALVWPDFCVSLLTCLHDEGIDTCIETEGHVPAATFRRAAPLLDHLLFDLKHVDRARHLTATGVDGQLMFDNLGWAIAQGMDVTVRTPVIPGFNDGPEEARAMARALREVGATSVQLLPFHNFGEGKYALLDRDYAFHGVPNLHSDDLMAYRQAYLDEGVEAFF